MNEGETDRLADYLQRNGVQAEPIEGGPQGELIAGGVDGKLRLYLLDPEALESLARSRVTRTLTPAECHKYLHQEQCPG